MWSKLSEVFVRFWAGWMDRHASMSNEISKNVCIQYKLGSCQFWGGSKGASSGSASSIAWSRLPQPPIPSWLLQFSAKDYPLCSTPSKEVTFELFNRILTNGSVSQELYFRKTIPEKCLGKDELLLIHKLQFIRGWISFQTKNKVATQTVPREDRVFIMSPIKHIF